MQQLGVIPLCNVKEHEGKRSMPVAEKNPLENPSAPFLLNFIFFHADSNEYGLPNYLFFSIGRPIIIV